MQKLTTALGVICLMFAAALALWDDERPSVPPKSLPGSAATPNPTPMSTAPVSSTSVPTVSLSPAERRASAEVRAKAERTSIRTPQFLLEKPSPSYQAHRESWRRQVGPQYIDLASALHVPQATADRVLDVLADAQLHYQEMIDKGGAADGTEMNARATAARDATSQERRQALLALLGEAGYERWQDYDESQQTRYQVRDLRHQLANTAEPLRDDQFEPLIAAVHAERVRLNAEIRAYAKGAAPGQDRDLRDTDEWMQHVAATRARIHASAQSILTAGQLARLDSMMFDFRYQEAQRSKRLQRLVEKRARENRYSTSN